MCGTHGNSAGIGNFGGTIQLSGSMVFGNSQPAPIYPSSFGITYTPRARDFFNMFGNYMGQPPAQNKVKQTAPPFYQQGGVLVDGTEPVSGGLLVHSGMTGGL